MFGFGKPPLYEVQKAINFNDIAELEILLKRFARVDSRSDLSPWETLLDSAIRQPGVEVVSALLRAGAKPWGTSQVLAIQSDRVDLLDAFAASMPAFWTLFQRGTPAKPNHLLIGRAASFNALEFAISYGAPSCATFLEQHGLKSRENKKCRLKCRGVFTVEEEFSATGGMSIDGLSIQSAGYHCVRCNGFIPE